MKSPCQIEQRAKEILNEAAIRCPQWASKLHAMKIRISSRMTNCAGRASYRHNLVKLSLPFFADEHNFQTALLPTVTHEAAHLIVGLEGRNRQPHGLQWQTIDKALGGTGQRCHTLELADGFARRVQPRVSVPCPKCNQPMSMGSRQYTKHRKLRAAGLLGYVHKKCP